ncbi:hypothetical protein [Vibrio sp. HN007]|uniref:hypothetical protein n=1 Tax=Vibrio iocasae TaxID=3098914 RepID=UPI0035D49179
MSNQNVQNAIVQGFMSQANLSWGEQGGSEPLSGLPQMVKLIIDGKVVEVNLSLFQPMGCINKGLTTPDVYLVDGHRHVHVLNFSNPKERFAWELSSSMRQELTNQWQMLITDPLGKRVSSYNEKFKAKYMFEQPDEPKFRPLICELQKLAHIDITEEIALEEQLEQLGIQRMAESQVVATQRFAVKRAQFLEKHDLYDAKQLAQTLQLRDSNANRAVNKLRDSQSVLAVKTQDGFMYPAFQLDREACIYEPLSHALPKLYKSMTGWDIAFWLTECFTVTMEITEMPDSVVEDIVKQELSLDDMADVVSQDETPDGTVTSRPIDLLVNGDDATFSVFVEALLHEDTRVIPHAKG